MYKVSVVIPAYKAEGTIIQAVESILSQKNILTEIIIIEDGRYDDTNKVLQPYLKEITYFAFDKNLGAQSARNKGLSLSSFPLILFLDADDYFEGDFLYYLVESAIKNKADIVFGNCIKRWESGREKYFYNARNFINETPIEVVVRWLTGKAGPAPCSVLWKKETLLKLGAWNEKYHKNQDGELVMRAMFNQVKISHSTEGRAIYRQYKGDRISQRVDSRAFKSQAMLFDYIRESAYKSDEKEMILDALNYYTVGIINSLYKSGNREILVKWEKMWKRKLPKVYLIKYHGYKVYIKHLLYYLFGIQNINIVVSFLVKIKYLKKIYYEK